MSGLLGWVRALLIPIFLGIGTAACDRQPPSPAPATAPASVRTPALIEQGRAIYNFRCYFCHGYSGDGKTLAATYITPPPRNFQAESATTLTESRIIFALQNGRPGTAMKSFATVISPAEMAAVAAFVFDEFVVRKAPNTRYHTPENGWPDHDRYRVAFPFAKGEVALTEPPESLSDELQRGRKLYLESCISCHDRGKPVADPTIWDSRPLSYPRYNYDHRNPEVDAATSATPYRIHDVPPKLNRPSALQKRGETLFQENCAFCHAADGTGKNWIGAFLEPHPRNLTDPSFMKSIDRARLTAAIQNGIPGSSMPAWKLVLDETQISAIITYIDAAFHPVAQ